MIAELTGLAAPAATVCPQQATALALLDSRANVCLTGMAGTGKSYVLKQYLLGVLARAERGVWLTATTGVAAMNIQDALIAALGAKDAPPVYTVYRWAGIGIGPKPTQSFEDFYAERSADLSRAAMGARTRVIHAHTLVIDEVSMFPGRLLDYLDHHCRHLRRRLDEPFGGLRLVVVGDFLQLPPVSKGGRYDWAFASAAWAAADFQVAYLTTIHRQAGDPEFADTLNAIREGKVRGDLIAKLQGRVAKFPPADLTRIFTHNAAVEKWNLFSLGRIESPEFIFHAELSGKSHESAWLADNLITPYELRLKLGAKVMLTANADYTDAFNLARSVYAANGTMGEVFDIDERDEVVEVRIKATGDTLVVPKRTFSYDMQREDAGKFHQFPLRLAYAITVHKSQGLTLDAALIDIRSAMEPGQAYVALSRVRSMAGLFLKDAFKGVVVSPDALAFYAALTPATAATA